MPLQMRRSSMQEVLWLSEKTSPQTLQLRFIQKAEVAH